MRQIISLGFLALFLCSCSPTNEAGDGFSWGNRHHGLFARNETRKLTASDAQDGDKFGYSVSVSGDTAIAGAYLEDGAGTWRGAAYVFDRRFGGDDNWGERKKLTASDAQNEDWFGNSVAISGDTAIVGAVWEDGAGNNRGAAYIFERNFGGDDNWGERVKLTASDAQDIDSFGSSVAISGDTAIVGTTYGEAVYVFDRNLGGDDNWGEVKKLTASDAEDDDLFGYSVGLSGDTAVVGASSESGAGLFRGAAYVFERNFGGDDNWGERKKLMASDAENSDYFGISVAISGDTAVAGAYAEAGAGFERGAVYVFDRNFGGDHNWGERTKITASDADDLDRFGIAVAISGDTAVAGAHYEDGTGANRGAAYVFERNLGGSDSWEEAAKLTASDAENEDELGYSIAISGNTTIAGAYKEGNSSGSLRGAAYVFEQLWDDGDACAHSAECLSGNCIDGVCCDTDCGGGDTDDCLACSVDADGASNGTCGPRVSGSDCDDGLFCNGPDTCDASGVCGIHAGSPCPGADGDGDCRESCDEDLDACTAADPDESGCDDGDNCTSPDTCSGGECLPGADSCQECTDTDDDGYGDPASSECTHPELDCDDDNAAVNPGADETCNEIDDDCDGSADEGCDCTPGQTRACYDGPAGSEGVGLCKAGIQECGSGGWGDCQDKVLPAPEDCSDDLDNDCDGFTDADDTVDCDVSASGGCGCSASGRPASGSAIFLALLAILSLVRIRSSAPVS